MIESKANEHKLRTGWTTGACATAAAGAAYEALLTGRFPPNVTVALPRGERPTFQLAVTETTGDGARAGVIKDAGDDPDVTHGALVIAAVRNGPKGSGITFRAGPGVGVITREGLPLPPGEPAINPMPRIMIADAIRDVAQRFGGSEDVVVEISVPEGKRLAERTLNARLGILGGLSILGTTGVVIPFSCSAWIHSIHRGVDVARAAGIKHIAGATGKTSESAIKALYDLPDVALIDMGDFVGGMLKYLRTRPIAKVSIGGGFAKMTKLGHGVLDLHSRRGGVDLEWLAGLARRHDAPQTLVDFIPKANSGLDALNNARAIGFDLATPVAAAACQTAREALRRNDIDVEVVVFNRSGSLLGRSSGCR